MSCTLCLAPPHQPQQLIDFYFKGTSKRLRKRVSSSPRIMLADLKQHGQQLLPMVTGEPKVWSVRDNTVCSHVIWPWGSWTLSWVKSDTFRRKEDWAFSTGVRVQSARLGLILRITKSPSLGVVLEVPKHSHDDPRWPSSAGAMQYPILKLWYGTSGPADWELSRVALRSLNIFWEISHIPDPQEGNKYK